MAYGTGVVESGPDGNFNYAIGGGSLWTSLASNQHTLVYASLDNGDVRSFYTETYTQGPDFVTGANAKAVRMLPDGSLLALDKNGVVTHWAAPCPGCYPYQKVFSYALPVSVPSMALDPDGVSFWTIYPYYDDVNQLGSYNLYRTNIKTGQVISYLNVGKLYYGRYYSGSIGVYGDGMNSTASWTVALKFGSQLLGTTSPSHAISIKNTGKVEMVVSKVEISGDFVISNNRCNSGIRPGTHCNIYVRFQPTQLGARNGMLTAFDNATNSPQATNLSGNGVTTSATVLTSSPNPSIFAQTVTFTAKVASNAPGTPTGTVSFTNGSQKIGSATLNAGAATFQTSKLPVGTLSITAAYSGDSENQKSTSPVLPQVVK
jgi:hypothetical protein